MTQPSSPSARGAPRPELHDWMVQYGPALRAYFRKKVGVAEADDLVQDVFLAMQARGPLEDTEHVNRYLFRVAANAVAKRRQAPGWKWPAYAEVDENAVQDGVSPERTLIAKQTLSRLLEAMRELPPRSAQAFALHRFDEMTYGEIAAHMGISVKAVEALMKRALERITARLEGVR